MADQCIVCLEDLDTSDGSPQSVAESPPGDQPGAPAVVAGPPAIDTAPAQASSRPTSPNGRPKKDGNVAVIQICGHMLHDSCLREWIEKANSCPVCRQSFHLVQVFDSVGGTLLSSYKVEDKKQVAEFDPQAWLEENEVAEDEEEEVTPCPVCNLADNEDVLLLCDGCDTPYHTYCIGLSEVPDGSWFCMECRELLDMDDAAPASAPTPAQRRGGRRSDFFPRTQASMRRARQRARSDEWQGAWGEVTGRVWDALEIDLDNHGDDDDGLEQYRRSQRMRERELREYQRWQQRLNIASQQGARDVFRNNIPSVFGLPADSTPSPAPVPAPQRTQRLPLRETGEERRAWSALERAIDADVEVTGSRKRKSRSVSSSPAEPRQEPERKLKRPRTRRLAVQNEASSSRSPPLVPARVDRNGSTPSTRPPPRPLAEAPSFLSSLLREVEMSTPSDDENVRNLFGPPAAPNDPSSPVTSPSGSGYSSPRALSLTPPPQRANRPNSPTLSLSSHIEPIYPPANYSPTRETGDGSDSENRTHRNGAATISEIRQPRPQRSSPVKLPRSQDTSPARSPLPYEMKESISSIVRSVLKPHWKSSHLTAEQYENINRAVSQKIYKEVADPAAVDQAARALWEKLATKEVARAIEELKA